MADFLIPDWPAPTNVRAFATTRAHGNLADHVAYEKSAVAARRAELRRHLPGEPVWLSQVHGTRCVEAEASAPGVEADAAAADAFVAGRPGKWGCDLYALARRRLRARGVERVFGGHFCTFSEAGRFYSYRREGVTGRMASLIWTV